MRERPGVEVTMHTRLAVCATLLLAALGPLGAAARGQDSRPPWLDAQPLAAWNQADGTIPPPPVVDEPVNPKCRDQARPVQTAEDQQLRDLGWSLVGPFQGGWGVLVVRATAGWDGMCRPMQYQDFVFVSGRFAGTLAPAPMDSRTDGAIGDVSLLGPDRITAQYLRYTDDDPLCCPSRITSVEFSIEGDPSVVRARSASTSGTTMIRR